MILALAGRVGMGRTFGEESLLMPIPERFFAGGDYSLRGFGVDEVRPEGGNAVLLGTAELRVDTGRGISAAAFTDVGNVYRLASDIEPQRPALHRRAGPSLQERPGAPAPGLGLQARPPRGRKPPPTST